MYISETSTFLKTSVYMYIYIYIFITVTVQPFAGLWGGQQWEHIIVTTQMKALCSAVLSCGVFYYAGSNG